MDEDLNNLIKGAFKAGRETYGQRRIKEALLNKQRMPSSNNYLSPIEFEEKMLRIEMVA